MTSNSGYKIKNIIDPFMGSGTTLVEGVIHGYDVYGNDINPLSILMSKAKTTAINPSTLETLLDKILTDIALIINNDKIYYLEGLKLPEFKNIEFWFKPYVIEELAIIRDFIFKLKK